MGEQGDQKKEEMRSFLRKGAPTANWGWIITLLPLQAGKKNLHPPVTMTAMTVRQPPSKKQTKNPSSRREGVVSGDPSWKCL